MKGKIIFLLMAFLLIGSVFSLEGAKAEEPRIALVLSFGGLGDEAFNDAAFRGYQMALEDFDVDLTYVEPADIPEFEEHQRAYAEAGYDLIIAIGFYQEDSLQVVAQEYPDVHFAIVDTVVDLPNVASITFKEHEGSFLVGVLAGMMTETNRVGFVGGLEIPLIKKFEVGFLEGLQYANPDADLLVNYAGDFLDPGTGKELAISQFERNADIIFHAAGGTGMGVIEAAEEMGKYAIGVDSNQDHLAPGTVLTSMIKRVDVAVYEIIAEKVEGRFTPGLMTLGVADDGVGVTDFEYTKDIIPQEVIDLIEEIKDKIAAGEIEVTDPTQ